MMLDVLMRGRSPFAPRKESKERMRRAYPLSRARSDPVQQCQHRRAFFLERGCSDRMQLRRGRRSLGERKHIQDQMLEGNTWNARLFADATVSSPTAMHAENRRCCIISVTLIRPHRAVDAADSERTLLQIVTRSLSFRIERIPVPPSSGASYCYPAPFRYGGAALPSAHVLVR